VRVHTPAWLRLAGLDEHADRLAGFAEIRPDTVQSVKPVLDATLEDVRGARVTAWGATWDTAGGAAMVAARVAVDAAWDIAGLAAGVAARGAAGVPAGA